MCRIRSAQVASRLEEIFAVYRHDEARARELLPDGSYRRVGPELPPGAEAERPGLRAQSTLIERALAAVTRPTSPRPDAV